GGEFSDDVSTAMQLRRNRSTRSLWDPKYVDESWIGDKVRLIPRMREWAAGLPIGITEYNWGAEGNMNGATAQADVLGIFGREDAHRPRRRRRGKRGIDVADAAGEERDAAGDPAGRAAAGRAALAERRRDAAGPAGEDAGAPIQCLE